MELEIIQNALSIILFFGFGMAAFIAFSTIDRQKEIVITSRYGRQTGPLEILYVNIALVIVAVMLYNQSYRFLPALVAFVFLIFFNSRMQSGIAPEGVFIGTTFLEWGKIKSYRIVNNEISTIEVQVYANRKRYVLKCDKQYRAQAEEYFEKYDIPIWNDREVEA